MTEYYTVNEMYGEKFYQVPKVFFTNPLYKDNLTPLEKMAFGMLKDRFTLSVKNKWFDEHGRIYFIFTQENLMEIFDCSKQTASNVKKNLKKVGLLEIKKRGQGNVDLLYLKKPIVTENDIYEIDKAESVGAVKTSKNETSKSLENRPQEVSKIDGNDTDLKETDLNDTDLLTIVNLQGDQILNDPIAFKKTFKDVCNTLHASFAPGRWSKKQWNTLIDKFVSETVDHERYKNIPVGKMKGYAFSAINSMASRSDYKKDGTSKMDDILDNIIKD